jgi:hypothetical protein
MCEEIPQIYPSKRICCADIAIRKVHLYVVLISANNIV